MIKKIFLFVLLSFSFVFCEWSEFYSSSGSCKILFPSAPQHLYDQFEMSGSSKKMQYDVYLSNENSDIFLMVVAQYPFELTDDQKVMSLEGFLQGFLQGGNQLMQADVVNILGHQGLEFFVKNHEKSFKGCCLIVGSTLYLLAMEGSSMDFKEETFKKFISSFQLVY